jgi:gluconokinase
MVIIIMGVAGSGKTTVGTALGQALAWHFVDADDLHSPANVEKMSRGEPLSDADRDPWLDAIHQVILRAVEDGESVVIACSALKAAYRSRLARGQRGVHFVHLSAPRVVLEARLAARSGHFAGPSLLDSQLDTLEVPADALVLDGSESVGALVARVRHSLGV